MTVTLELTPHLAQTLSDAAAGKVTDVVTLQQVLRQMAAAIKPALPENDDKPLKRIAGLASGDILWISDNFDEPLPDSFWLGEAGEDI